VDLMHLTEDKDQWRVLLNAAMKLRFQWKAGNLLASLWRRSLRHSLVSYCRGKSPPYPLDWKLGEKMRCVDNHENSNYKNSRRWDSIHGPSRCEWDTLKLKLFVQKFEKWSHRNKCHKLK
jgi:hypothetical protein